MTFATEFLYLAHRVHIDATDEVAQTGVRIPVTTGSAASALAQVTQSDLDDLDDLFIALYTASGHLRADYARNDGVRLAAVGTDGLETTDPLVQTSPTAFSGGDANVPPQMSVCLSLRSGSTFGRANYGRMYLPYTRFGLSGTPYASQSNAADTAAAGADYVAGVNIILQGESPIVLGGVQIMSSVGSGTNKPVSDVLCDRVADVQRRRANRLAHVYETAPVA